MADELSILMRLRGNRQVDAGLEGTSRQIERLERQARRAGRPIASMGRAMDRTGTMLTRRLSMPLAIAGGAAVKMGFDYERTMTRVLTLTDAGAVQVAKWEDQIMGLAKETAVAPRELADALYFLASSGLPVNQVFSALETTAKGTALGLGDSATIAQLVTSAMNAYAKSGLTAAGAMDVLIAGTEAGKLEAAELSESLGRVLPLASRLGVPLRGVVAAMEGMSMAGADADQAATQVSAFLSQLIRPRPQGVRALKAVGLTYRGLLEQLRDPKVGLLGVVKILDQAFNGDIIAQGKVFTNVRALRTQLGLTGDMGARVDEVFRQTMDSSGKTSKAWARLGTSDAFKLQKGIVAVQVAMIRLGTMLAPTVTRIASGVERLADAFSGHGKTGLSVMLALIALGPVLKVAGFGMKVLGASMMGARLAAMGYTGSVFMATAGTYGFTAALLASPITWIVLGLAAVALGFYILYTRVEGFRNAVHAVWNWIKSHWRLLTVLGLGPVGVAIVLIVNHFKTLKRWIVIVWNWAKKLGGVLDKLKSPLEKVGGVAGKVAGGIGKGAGAVEGFLGGLAGGGPVYASGKYLVGERGPEIVSIPAGAHVTPNERIGREFVTAPIILKLDGRTVAETQARVVADRKARK